MTCYPVVKLLSCFYTSSVINVSFRHCTPPPAPLLSCTLETPELTENALWPQVLLRAAAEPVLHGACQEHRPEGKTPTAFHGHSLRDPPPLPWKDWEGAGGLSSGGASSLRKPEGRKEESKT